ncbi:hypothetical protein PHET_01186 [Paragonimus heterotremus]|uniref:Uncharacterized protein n=1 Tax=Paragonimus heterotremus TaxID=100268 RepID=A0A8J4SSR2_9TREM|nr:hypothetical protein PHET_01186 [Paragonimus heterotremus]
MKIKQKCLSTSVVQVSHFRIICQWLRAQDHLNAHLSGSTQKRHHQLTKSQPQSIKPMESETVLVQHTPLCFQKPTYNQRGIFQRNFYETTTADLAFPQSSEASHVFAHVVTGGPLQANDFSATLQKTMDPAHVHASYMQAMCEPTDAHVQ